MIRIRSALPAILLAALFATAFAQETGVRAFGHATVYGTPDIAFVTVGVDVGDADARSAIAGASEAMNGLRAAVSALGIADEDVRTVVFSVFRDERYGPDGQPIGGGYRVIHQVQVVVRDLDQLGDLLADAVEAGANSVGGIEFGIADAGALEAQARQEAVADAFAKAEALAAAAGVTLGAPIGISDAGGFGGGPIAEAAAMRDAAFSVPVASGQLAVTVHVSVLFAIDE